MQKPSRKPAKAKAAKKQASSKPRGEGRARKIARVVDAALKDADAARKDAFDPRFRQGLGADRRSALSRFKTVQQALADRERIEKERLQKEKGSGPRGA